MSPLPFCHFIRLKDVSPFENKANEAQSLRDVIPETLFRVVK
jgi:hypothetical protein